MTPCSLLFCIRKTHNSSPSSASSSTALIRASNYRGDFEGSATILSKSKSNPNTRDEYCTLYSLHRLHNARERLDRNIDDHWSVITSQHTIISHHIQHLVPLRIPTVRTIISSYVLYQNITNQEKRTYQPPSEPPNTKSILAQSSVTSGGVNPVNVANVFEMSSFGVSPLRSTR